MGRQNLGIPSICLYIFSFGDCSSLFRVSWFSWSERLFYKHPCFVSTVPSLCCEHGNSIHRAPLLPSLKCVLPPGVSCALPVSSDFYIISRFKGVFCKEVIQWGLIPLFLEDDTSPLIINVGSWDTPGSPTIEKILSMKNVRIA